MGNPAASVRAMEPASAAETVDRDAEARRWIAALRASGLVREEAAARLHGMLLRAAQFELGRRHGTAAMRARRRAWQHRELPTEPHDWSALPARALEPVEELEIRDRLQAVVRAIQTELSPHQREVLGALVLADVPIDVLAERLGTTRGALYKTLHDARRKLRTAIGAEDDVLA